MDCPPDLSFSKDYNSLLSAEHAIGSDTVLSDQGSSSRFRCRKDTERCFRDIGTMFDVPDKLYQCIYWTNWKLSSSKQLGELTGGYIGNNVNFLRIKNKLDFPPLVSKAGYWKGGGSRKIGGAPMCLTCGFLDYLNKTESCLFPATGSKRSGVSPRESI